MRYIKKRNDLLHGYIIPGVIALFLTLFASVTILSLRYSRRNAAIGVLTSDIEQLAQIFKKINKTSKIISFDHQKNWINFLQIKKGGFKGSEIGSMNLVYPKKWEGPYLKDNPTYQSKEYQVVRTQKGYFIVPGEGVTLPNGKVLGKDIILDEGADIEQLVREKNGLMSGDKPLALKINVG